MFYNQEMVLGVPDYAGYVEEKTSPRENLYKNLK